MSLFGTLIVYFPVLSLVWLSYAFYRLMPGKPNAIVCWASATFIWIVYVMICSKQHG